MSEFLNLEADQSQPLDGDDIDALNDETFGCDVNEINDDWEEEHEKFVGDTGSRDDSDDEDPSEWQGSSTQLIDSKRSLVLDSSNLDLLSKRYRDSSKIEPPGNLPHHGFGNKSNRGGFNIDDLFPYCEDLIKKSVFDVVSDEGDLLGDYVSEFSQYDPDVANGSFRNSSTSKDSQIEEKAQDIDLETLRPPSPSILPLDHTFMSNVWRPPSPDQSINNSNHRYSPKDSTHKCNTSNSIFNSSTPVLPGKLPNVSKILRVEDLEADLSRDHSNRSNSSPKNPLSSLPMPPSSMMNSSSAMISGSPFGPNVHSKPPTNMVIGGLAALSLGQMLMNNAPSIPAHSKMVQPPPGFTLPQPSPNKTSSPVQTNHQNIKTRSSMVEQQQHKIPPLINLINNVAPKASQILQPTLPFQPMLFMRSANENLDTLMQQKQIIDRIITPAQAQRSYRRTSNCFNRNLDKFAGFMTQKEKDWLIKIFRLQCKVNDPYVEDYYEVNYMLKKNSMKILARQKELMRNGGEESADLDLENEPILVLPELAKAEETGPKYIQFDNALGKIQVLSSKCPRKLVEFKEGETASNTYRLDSRSKCLLKIERLYEFLLDIEDEDKRMPILPEQYKQQHRDRRTLLCNELFNGLTIPMPKKEKANENQQFILINRVMPTFKQLKEKVDPNIMAINKGLLLVVRSLIHLQEVNHLIVLLASLMASSIFNRLAQIEKEMKINVGAVLMKAISRIQNAKALLYVVSCIDDARIFANHQHGCRLLVTIFKQYEQSEDKLLFIYFWKLFVKALIESIPETQEESQSICKEHLAYLNQL